MSSTPLALARDAPRATVTDITIGCIAMGVGADSARQEEGRPRSGPSSCLSSCKRQKISSTRQ